MYLKLKSKHITLLGTNISFSQGMVESMIFLFLFLFGGICTRSLEGIHTYILGCYPLSKCSLTTGILADFTQVNGEKKNLWMLRLYRESYYPVCWVLCFCHYEGSGSKPTMIISWKIAERAIFFVASFVDISFGTTYHRKFQVPKMEVLYLTRLF